jgi:hypothetical protein
VDFGLKKQIAPVLEDAQHTMAVARQMMRESSQVLGLTLALAIATYLISAVILTEVRRLNRRG